MRVLCMLCCQVLATHALEGKAFLEPALTTDKDVEVRVQAMKVNAVCQGALTRCTE